MVSKEVTRRDEKLYKAIISYGFKIVDFAPLLIERALTSNQDIVKLIELLDTSDEPGEGNDRNTQEPVSSSIQVNADETIHADSGNVHAEENEMPAVDKYKSEKIEGSNSKERLRPRPKIDKSFGFGKLGAPKKSPPKPSQAINLSEQEKSVSENQRSNETMKEMTELREEGLERGAVSAETFRKKCEILIIKPSTEEGACLQTEVEIRQRQKGRDTAVDRQFRHYQCEEREEQDGPRYRQDINQEFLQSDVVRPGTEYKPDGSHRESSKTQENIAMMLTENSEQVVCSEKADDDRDEGSEIFNIPTSASVHSVGARMKEKWSDYPDLTANRRALSPSASRQDGPLVYQGRHGDLKVQIYMADITKIQMDCIVNAANAKLKHGGAVAKAIESAAGRQLQDACEEYTRYGKTVEVTNIFVSPGGNLPAKYVLHAVGPKWDLYDKQDKEQWVDDLRHTILRCLLEAGCRGMSSIAFPSISAAIFRVPPELFAQSYMEAVKVFDEFNAAELKSDLSDIHFVDVVDTMVSTIQECFLGHWEDPVESPVKHKDFDFCRQHLKSRQFLPARKETACQLQQWNRASGHGHNPAGSFSSPSPSGAAALRGQTYEKNINYQIEGIQLCVSSKPALSIPSDLIITIGDVFDKLSGLINFSAESSKKRSDKHHKKDHYEFFLISKPDGTRNRLLCCTVKRDSKDPEGIKKAFGFFDAATVLAGVGGPAGVTKVTSFILTSSFLYAEASSKKTHKKEGKTLDRKLVKRFAHLLLDYLKKASKKSQLKQVTVAASDDAVPLISEVMLSRGIDIRTTSSASGAYLWSSQNSQHMSEQQRTSRGRSPARGTQGMYSSHGAYPWSDQNTQRGDGRGGREMSPARNNQSSSSRYGAYPWPDQNPQSGAGRGSRGVSAYPWPDQKTPSGAGRGGRGISPVRYQRSNSPHGDKYSK